MVYFKGATETVAYLGVIPNLKILAFVVSPNIRPDEICDAQGLQGYLVHKKPPPPLGPP